MEKGFLLRAFASQRLCERIVSRTTLQLLTAKKAIEAGFRKSRRLFTRLCVKGFGVWVLDLQQGEADITSARGFKQLALGAVLRFAIPGFGSLVGAVSSQYACSGVVVEIDRHDFVADAVFEIGVFDREHHFDAAIEVARHPIGTRKKNLLLWSPRRK